MHHILAFAKMIISDSQTMTIEAAVLGIPAVRINTFIGKSTVIDELENKYQLAFGFLPDQGDQAIECVKTTIENPQTDLLWNERREILLSDKKDLNQFLINYILNEFIK